MVLSGHPLKIDVAYLFHSALEILPCRDSTTWMQACALHTASGHIESIAGRLQTAAPEFMRQKPEVDPQVSQL
jgi:hypothetical protein